jgi:hypothetical protein
MGSVQSRRFRRTYYAGFWSFARMSGVPARVPKLRVASIIGAALFS